MHIFTKGCVNNRLPVELSKQKFSIQFKAAKDGLIIAQIFIIFIITYWDFQDCSSKYCYWGKHPSQL